MATIQSRRHQRVGVGHRAQHRALAVLSAVMAFAAYAGAVGLAGGGMDFGPHQTTIMARIPWHSTALAGVALALAVAVPMTISAVLAWRGSPRAGAAALVAGAALMAWILVEALIIRTYSWMQPTCVVWGILVAAIGGHLSRRRT